MKSTLLERELDLSRESYSRVTGVIKLKEGDSEMMISDNNFGLTWFSFDLENSTKEFPDLRFKPVLKLFDYVTDDYELFGASDDNGTIKIYRREAVEDEDSVSVEIQELRKFRGHKGEVNGLTHFRDGSYVS